MLTPGRNYVNSPIQVSINLQNNSDVDVDPETVTFKTRSPCGTEASYVYGTDDEVTKSSVGDYDAVFTPDEAGRWFYRWEATGTGTTIATEGNFLVQHSEFYDNDVGYA
jgi:hypothetical protein